MSEQQIPQVRDEEPELNDETLEQVAGGCAINSQDHDQWNQWTLPIKPSF
ncbi:MAG TPA: hypothetical protein VEX86_16360 [Longimicrobium sp.]|nr:hypothetical protein [Longimicrobium sp.]